MPKNVKSSDRFRTVFDSAVVCQFFKRSIGPLANSIQYKNCHKMLWTKLLFDINEFTSSKYSLPHYFKYKCPINFHKWGNWPLFFKKFFKLANCFLIKLTFVLLSQNCIDLNYYISQLRADLWLKLPRLTN